MRHSIGFVALLLAACAATPDAPAPVVAAPDIPDTEIFLGRLARSAGGMSVFDLVNVTNHAGYDNQPYFLADGDAFYYVSAGESGKTDIRLYNLARGASPAVFVSPDKSEYSPKEAPGGGLSYIQENPAGDVTRVHRRKDGAAIAVADFAPVGYYAWLDGGAALAVYYRTEPGSLYRVEVKSGAPSLLREAIGRPMQADAAGRLLWFAAIDAEDPSAFRLTRYDVLSGAIVDLFAMPEGGEHFAIDFDAAGVALGVFSAGGSTLYRRSLEQGDAKGWVVVGDLGSAGVANASRIAVSLDGARIAIVGEISR
jgi:hypothetical protein